MLKAIHDEARKIARTKDDENTVAAIARIAAKAATAQNPNGPGDDEQMDSFIRENLR
jgi:hypothetical protein